MQECQTYYDTSFANGFNELLTASENDDGTLLKTHLKLIEDHLKSKKCPSFCSKLWSGFIV